ncbi:MAG TPA: hypothetical protein VG537_07805 [Candidatus Kapabacteria bacterium]|nr:hypothetical protein [Candidatus Kapabacteria bacterium]
MAKQYKSELNLLTVMKMAVLSLIIVLTIISIVPLAVHLALHGPMADNWIPKMELFLMTVSMFSFGLLAREIDVISFRKALTLTLLRSIVASALTFVWAWVITL